jgi:small subunit ribosomal protein S15
MEKLSKPVWLKMSEKELIEVIKELAEKYEQPAQIGTILRDQYGIPSTKLYGKKLKEYLKEVGHDSNIELKNAEKKLEKLKEHLKKNITDRKAKHRLQKAQSRTNILKRYFAKKKR